MNILRRRTVLDTSVVQNDNGKGYVLCNGYQQEKEDYVRPKEVTKRKSLFIKRNMDRDK